MPFSKPRRSRYINDRPCVSDIRVLICSSSVLSVKVWLLGI